MSKKIDTILKQALKRKQLKNPQYTLSVLARDLKVSRAFVSSLLQGKKKLPLERLESLGRRSLSRTSCVQQKTRKLSEEEKKDGAFESF